ncbi:hypothetical protein [Roseburia inulinivorans]
MIIKAIMELVFSLLQIVFTPINLPDLPPGIQSVLDELMGLFTSVIGLVGIFLDLNVVKWLIPVVIVIANLDKVWKLIMFILRKIPFIGVE